MALRVASLDYLGTVAARLRKDAVTSQMDQRSIDRILKEVNVQSNTEQSEHAHIFRLTVTMLNLILNVLAVFPTQTQGNDETQQLQKALLAYMDENAETDPSLVVSVFNAHTVVITARYLHIRWEV